MSRPVYIYGLVDPRTSQVRYIGQTKNPAWRRGSHRTRKVPCRSAALQTWLDEMRADGYSCEMTLLEESDEESASDAEMAWISHYRAADPPLLNVVETTYPRAYPPDWVLFQVSARVPPEELSTFRSYCEREAITQTEGVRRMLRGLLAGEKRCLQCRREREEAPS